MSETTRERDTHFAGFARVLHGRLQGKSEQEQHQIIARAAYDLACHVVYETSYGLDRFYIPERINEVVSDLVEWPE